MVSSGRIADTPTFTSTTTATARSTSTSTIIPRRTFTHESGRRGPVAVWTLFIIFPFGPCEPLVPLLLVPAAQGRWLTLAGTALVFSTVTILAMLAAVLAMLTLGPGSEADRARGTGCPRARRSGISRLQVNCSSGSSR
jgi:hypothetical protein